MTTRRTVVKALAVTPIAALTWTRQDVDLAAAHVADLTAPQAAKFFNAQEWKTILVLVDDVFPKDEMGGSATEAKVPEFMDYVLNQGNENNRTNMRTGLTWLDQESRKRFTKGYADCTPADRHRILDDIAFPAKAPEEFRANAAWFSSVRNLCAGGYFSSRVGYKAIGFMGGVAMPNWKGSSPEIMKKLSLSYDEWDKKYGRGY